MYLIYFEKIPSNPKKDIERLQDCSVSFGRLFGSFFLCDCQTAGKHFLQMLYLR